MSSRFRILPISCPRKILLLLHLGVALHQTHSSSSSLGDWIIWNLKAGGSEHHSTKSLVHSRMTLSGRTALKNLGWIKLVTLWPEIVCWATCSNRCEVGFGTHTHTLPHTLSHCHTPDICQAIWNCSFLSWTLLLLVFQFSLILVSHWHPLDPSTSAQLIPHKEWAIFPREFLHSSHSAALIP